MIETFDIDSILIVIIIVITTPSVCSFAHYGVRESTSGQNDNITLLEIGLSNHLLFVEHFFFTVLPFSICCNQAAAAAASRDAVARFAMYVTSVTAELMVRYIFPMIAVSRIINFIFYLLSL